MELRGLAVAEKGRDDPHDAARPKLGLVLRDSLDGGHACATLRDQRRVAILALRACADVENLNDPRVEPEQACERDSRHGAKCAAG
ncbi:MAG: hypothetical protein WDO24_22520 [Pseudomonadota bacterium]